MSFIQSLKDKSNLIVGGGLIYIAIAEYSSEVPYPWEVPARVSSSRPDSRRLCFGYLGAGKLDEFLPDENGIFLIAFRASDDTGGAIWEITEDQFDAMEVHTQARCSMADRETSLRSQGVPTRGKRSSRQLAGVNRRVTTRWRLSGGRRIDHIEEIRTVLEPEAQKSRRLQRRIRSIIPSSIGGAWKTSKRF